MFIEVINAITFDDQLINCNYITFFIPKDNGVIVWFKDESSMEIEESYYELKQRLSKAKLLAIQY